MESIMKVGDLVKYGKINPHLGIIVELVGNSYGSLCSEWCLVYFAELDTTEIIHPDNMELA
jgi:hypothetical protein